VASPKPKEVKKEDKIEEVVNFQCREAIVVRRIELRNNSSYIAHVKISLVTASNDSVNFRVPLSSFTVLCKANKVTPLMAIMKINPDLPFGQYEIACHV